MSISVPSLEGGNYLTDPQSVIGYTLRKYYRTPAATIPIVPHLIISLPLQVAKFRAEPDTLCQVMQSDLQGVFSRIFANDKTTVDVACSWVRDSINSEQANITTVVSYTLGSGEIDQAGMIIGLNTTSGRLTLPEDNVPNSF